MKIMSTFTLKLIAIVAMLIDHVGAIFFSDQLWIRGIGRIAFPIFVFLLVEGLYNTSNIKKYLTRLGIFALISEIPFDMVFYKTRFGVDFLTDLKGATQDMQILDLFIKRILYSQNVFFTLFLGLMAIYLMKLVENKYRKQIFASNMLNALLTIGFCAAALILRTDYGMIGILMIVAFYLFRGSKVLLTFALLIVVWTLTDTTNTIPIQIFSVFAMVPIAFYNGKKGKDIKYLFYIFYPAHLLLLWLISMII